MYFAEGTGGEGSCSIGPVDLQAWDSCVEEQVVMGWLLKNSVVSQSPTGVEFVLTLRSHDLSWNESA